MANDEKFYLFHNDGIVSIIKKDYDKNLKILQNELPCANKTEFEKARTFVLEIQTNGTHNLIGVKQDPEIVEMAKNAKFIETTKNQDDELTF